MKKKINVFIEKNQQQKNDKIKKFTGIRQKEKWIYKKYLLKKEEKTLT